MQPRLLARAVIALGATTMIALLVLSVYRPVNASAVLAPGRNGRRTVVNVKMRPSGRTGVHSIAAPAQWSTPGIGYHCQAWQAGQRGSLSSPAATPSQNGCVNP